MTESKISTIASKMASTAKSLGGGSEKKSSTRALDLIVMWSIGLIFFLCPLFFTGLVAQGLGFEKMILFYFLVLLGIVAWVTKGVIQGELKLKRTPLDWPIVALVGVFAVSAFFSITTKDSLIGSYGNSTGSLIGVIIFALFYYLIVNNLDIKKIKTLFFLIISSVSLIIIYSFFQLLGIFLLPINFTNQTGFNPIGSLSGLTMFLVIALPLLVVMVTQIKEIYPKMNSLIRLLLRLVLSLVTLGGFAILLFLNGFTFWPAAIVGIVIVLMFFLSKIIYISNNNLVIPLASFLILIILLVLGNFSILNLNLPAEVSLSRGASWNIAKDSIKENPLLGSGPSTYYYNFSKFKGVDFNASQLWNARFNNASGIFFELISTVGVLGVLAFTVVLLIALSICFLVLIKLKEKEVHSVALALFASCVTIIIFAALFALNSAVILFSVLIFTLTVSSAVILYPEKFNSLTLSFRSSPKYALALAAIFLCVSAGVVVLFTMGLKMYLADIYARQALVTTELPIKINKLNKSIILFPYEDSYYLELANNYMAVANQEANTGKNQTVIENNLSLAIEAGRKAIEISPKKAGNNEALALIYENAAFYTRGALEWAEDLYNKLAELDPDNPVPALRIALIDMARANAEQDKDEQKYYINEAVKKYDEAISKKDNLAAAYYGKAIAAERLTNTDDAIEELKKAVLLNNQNVDYRFELGRMYFNRGVSQPNIDQTASKEITEEAITTEEENGDELSVETNTATGAVSGRNDDLTMSEQIFLSILQLNPKHANALYSLGLLYQKIGETDNASIVVKALLDIIEDDATKEVIQKQFPGLY